MSTYSFAHLLHLSTPIGTFEHAQYTSPRREHGYCTDDMARVLVVTTREPEPSDAVRGLAGVALRFLLDAQDPDGRTHNRRSASGSWLDSPSTDDWWGRSVWGLGTAAAGARDQAQRADALAGFERGATQRSRWSRSMAFAALGAFEVLSVMPAHEPARRLLADAATLIAPVDLVAHDDSWPWPEPRLTYANAALPEALLAAGSRLDRADLVASGALMLAWLLRRETIDGHLSPTPVGGAGPLDRAPRFDQQSIEIAAMADACHRAAAVTGDPRWLDGVAAASRWFAGDNDVGAVMWDTVSGGGYDGLHASGPNLNQGAESTLALISTLQRAALLTCVSG